LNGPLSPRAARVLYNVTDALAPDGAHPFDVAPAVEREIRHRGVGTARRTWLLLQWIEWLPRLSFRARRGFSWQPRDARRAWLRTVEESRVAPVRRAFAELRGWIEKARAEGAAADRAEIVPASGPAQSSGA
jgi:hypothetical protein